MTLGENINNAFGKVYVKNLLDAKQRLNHFKSHADAVNLTYETFKAIRGDTFVPENYSIKYRPLFYPTPANQYLVGNWASTLAIHLDAISNNYDSYVVCDDDTVFKNIQLAHIKPHLPTDWDIIILGEIHFNDSHEVNSQIRFDKIINNENLEQSILVGCQCIAVNKKFYFKLLLYMLGLDTHGKIGDVLMCLMVENNDINLYKLKPDITYQERSTLIPYTII